MWGVSWGVMELQKFWSLIHFVQYYEIIHYRKDDCYTTIFHLESSQTIQWLKQPTTTLFHKSLTLWDLVVGLPLENHELSFPSWAAHWQTTIGSLGASSSATIEQLHLKLTKVQIGCNGVESSLDLELWLFCPN